MEGDNNFVTLVKNDNLPSNRLWILTKQNDIDNRRINNLSKLFLGTERHIYRIDTTLKNSTYFIGKLSKRAQNSIVCTPEYLYFVLPSDHCFFNTTYCKNVERIFFSKILINEKIPDSYPQISYAPGLEEQLEILERSEKISQPKNRNEIRYHPNYKKDKKYTGNIKLINNIIQVFENFTTKHKINPLIIITKMLKNQKNKFDSSEELKTTFLSDVQNIVGKKALIKSWDIQSLAYGFNDDYYSFLRKLFSPHVELDAIEKYKQKRKYIKSRIRENFFFKQEEKGTTVHYSSLSLNYLYFLALQKEKDLLDSLVIDLILNLDARSSKGKSFTPVTVRLGNFSQHQMFLCQLALFGGGEELSLKTFEKIINDFKRIDYLKFYDYKHKVNLKFVLTSRQIGMFLGSNHLKLWRQMKEA